MRAAVHTVGDGTTEPDRESRSVRPYLEDLPLGPADVDDANEPAADPRRPFRRRRSLPPLVVALTLIAGLVFLVPTFDDPDTARSGSVPTQETTVASLAGVGDTPLLSAGSALPETTCDLPALSDDERGLRAFYEAELRCLERAWEPALVKAGVPFERVGVDLGDDPDTACGALPPADRATGLYCSDDGTIYLPRARTLEAFGVTTEAHLATLAHEYGHHIQHLSGILGGANDQLNRYPAGSDPDRDVGRRVELQANCFAGAFLASAGGRGSIDGDLARAAVDDFRNWVDSDTHGASTTQLEWALRGFQNDDLGGCDTWSAEAADVV